MSRVVDKFETFFVGGGVDGTAHYSRSISFLGLAIMEDAKSALVSAVGSVPFDPLQGRPFVIADMGCQDGGVSSVHFRRIIECVRQHHGTTVEILILYEDQPYNDFKSLFLMANSLLAAVDNLDWTLDNGVYFTAVGRSFFEQCFPDNFVHIGFSSHAVHFLSKRPNIPRNILHYSLSPDDYVKQLFVKQGMADWNRFLLLRCRELTPGGIFVVVALYTTDDGEESCIPKDGKNIINTLSVLWEQLYKEGRITKDEREGANYTFYTPTLGELKDPFHREDSPVLRAGLKLLSCHAQVEPCTFQASLKEHGLQDSGALAANAHNFVQSIQGWGSGPFRIALSSRPEAENRDIVDELFQRLEAEILTKPTLYKDDIPRATIVIQKVKKHS